MAGTKRKNEDAGTNGTFKRRAISDDEARQRFRNGLFDESALERYTTEYATSQPYKHGVIQGLMQPSLLRNVRSEIRENLHFTPKETDIYRIHQSGDLANLDGLEDSSLDRLPSLLQLRDALYSSAFRKYVAQVANSGPLSGKKTDMAINIYTPGCHLLCHDDVIGSRRVSYILYLTDPDVPWKSEWGGALRLYPTEEVDVLDEHPKESHTRKVPSPEFTVSIPPAFNQLSFFAVQPGESFHDVEEVYHQARGEDGPDGSRVRMAISGWYHIPQEGEEGFEEGLEAQLAEKSSLTQLQGRDSTFDLPQQPWNEYPDTGPDEIQANGEEQSEELTEADLEFLLRYITPQYLTPDTVEELSARFEDDSSLQLSNVLNKKYSEKLRSHITNLEEGRGSNGDQTEWATARPPHKHRFRYLLGSPRLSHNPDLNHQAESLADLMNNLLPSVAFRKWLGLVTGGLEIIRYNTMSRCFRRGIDYSLAKGYEEDQPRVEVCLGVTPTVGWPGTEDDEEAETNGASSTAKPAATADAPDNVGGYEVYMAGDDDEEEENEVKASSATGAGQRRKTDPAIYRAAADDEDDGVLFSMPASWNTMSIVLRDKGTLRFVKYVSKAAPGHRWDVIGEYEVEGFDEEDEEDAEDEEDEEEA